MRHFVLRRAGHAVLLLLISVLATFVFIHLAPGDAASLYYDPGADPAAMARVRHGLGLDDPLPTQIAKWTASVVRGDLGLSLAQRRPVARVLAEAIPRTLLLASAAFLVQLLAGFSLGAFAAARHRRVSGRGVTVGAVALYAVPAFYLAYLLISLFSLRLGWLPASGIRTVGAGELSAAAAIWDRVVHMVLPVFVLGVASAAGLARFTRGSLLEAMSEDYVRTARSKGLGEWGVIWRHAFRGALPPLLTVVGLSVPFLVGGAVVIEKVFAWPGMGSLLVDSIYARDYPVVLAINLIGAAMVILGNFLADLATAWADPRIKLARASTAAPEG